MIFEGSSRFAVNSKYKQSQVRDGITPALFTSNDPIETYGKTPRDTYALKTRCHILDFKVTSSLIKKVTPKGL